MYIYTYEVYERRVKSTMGVGHVKGGGGHRWGAGEERVELGCSGLDRIIRLTDSR